MVVITLLLELHSFFETNAYPQKEVLSYKKDAPKFIPRLGGLILFNADLIWKWFFKTNAGSSSYKKEPPKCLDQIVYSYLTLT